jgi:hypothetical protein
MVGNGAFMEVSVNYIDRMESSMSPSAFERRWPKPFQEGGIWYVSPKPYRYGFGTATNEASANWMHEQIRLSTWHGVKDIPWC